MKTPTLDPNKPLLEERSERTGIITLWRWYPSKRRWVKLCTIERSLGPWSGEMYPCIGYRGHQTWKDPAELAQIRSALIKERLDFEIQDARFNSIKD